MKKEYQKPKADFISLAPAEQLATGASYYGDGPDMGGGTASSPFN